MSSQHVIIKKQLEKNLKKIEMSNKRNSSKSKKRFLSNSQAKLPRRKEQRKEIESTQKV
jgi:hypothetical protein